MIQNEKDEKNADDAIQHLARAYVAYAQITDAGKRMVILGIAKKSLDDMLASFCQQNPDFTLGAFVALLGMGGHPVAPEPQEQGADGQPHGERACH